MTFATILPLIVQCKHTSRENALAPNLQQVSDETEWESSQCFTDNEWKKWLCDWHIQMDTCERNTELLTRLGRTRPEGLAGCQRNSWSKKENLLLFTHPYGCFKPVCFYLFLWHIKTTSIWVWNNIMRVSKEHNFHFWRTIALNLYAKLRRTHKWFCCTHFLFLQGAGHKSLHTLFKRMPTL